MGRTVGGSNQVRARRLTREFTQAQLAAAVGVSRQTVNALEAGDYAPSVFLALRLATALSATVEELFELDDVGTTASSATTTSTTMTSATTDGSATSTSSATSSRTLNRSRHDQAR